MLITQVTSGLTQFLCGSNLPWIEYSKDIMSFPKENQELVLREMDRIKKSGGNCIRWWVHTNGRNGLLIENNTVFGIDPNVLKNVRLFLQLANEMDIQVIMCLWSFDMLEHQDQNLTAMKNLICSDFHRRSYIENVLTPLISSVGDHPNLLTWELFNEPEGMSFEFGWTAYKVPMNFIQKTINQMAGSIKRISPNVAISLGCWNIKVLTNIEGHYNYYDDQRLVNEGGDLWGTVDFYQVHFYPKHFGNNTSPFHNPHDHWKVEKPILISEYPHNGCINGKTNPKKNTFESMEYAYQNGYAGCLSWGWPYAELEMGTFIKDAKPAIKRFSNIYLNSTPSKKNYGKL